MKSFLAKLLGLDGAPLAGAHWSDISVRFAGLPRSWWALATLLMVGVIVGITVRNYRRESDMASRAMKTLLAALRVGAFGIILFALFRPVLVIDKSRHLPSLVVVLVDDSLSMSLEDQYSDSDFVRRLALALGIPVPEKIRTMSRLDLIRAMLSKNDNGWLKELGRHHTLKLMTFSDTVKTLQITNQIVPANAPPKLLFNPAQLQAVGVATDLETGLRQALGGTQGQPLAALVLLTDGQSNMGDPIAASSLLIAKNVAVFPVGVGSADPPRNIEVQSIAANNVIMKDDEAVFVVRVASQGFEGRLAQLTLKEREQGGGAAGEILASQPVTFGADGTVQEISIRLRLPRVGLFTFSAEIAPQPGEFTDKDNTAAFPVRVIDQKVRVLLVSGDSGREYRYLKNYLIRDKSFAAQVWLQNASPDFVQESSQGQPPLAKLPREESGLFLYDVILFYDPMPRDLDGAWAKLLKKFVEDRGGGIFWMAGQKYTEDLLLTRDFDPLATMLPVVVERDSLAFREGISRIHLQPWPLLITPQGLDHPALQFDTDPDHNRNLWSVMPGFYWSQPIARAKPGAVVLAVHSDPRRVISEGPMPVIATQFYGAGRTFFLGMDATWRWRYVGAKYFEQFWGQTIRYLAEGRLLGGRKRMEFFTDQETYNLGRHVRITAKVFATDYTPAQLERLDVELRGENNVSVPVTLLPVPGNPAQLEATVLLEKTGLYEILPKTKDPQLAQHAATKHFRVVLPRLEFQQLRMNAPLLSDLARMTGGKFLAGDEFEKLPALIPAREQILVNEVTQDLWDTPLTLIIFCALLFVEWSLRKWKNMV